MLRWETLPIARFCGVGRTGFDTDWQSFVGVPGNAAGRVLGEEQAIFMVVLLYKRHAE